MSYSEEWDGFKKQYEAASNAERTALKSEFERLRQYNPVAQKELEQAMAAYGPRSGVTTPSSWDQAAVRGMASTYGSSPTLQPNSD